MVRWGVEGRKVARSDLVVGAVADILCSMSGSDWRNKMGAAVLAGVLRYKRQKSRLENFPRLAKSVQTIRMC